jgi:transmembrane sensor
MASVVRIAATVVLVLAGVGVWQRARHDSHRPAEGMLALRDYTTTRGQRAEIELGDGTRIVLGPASSLRVPRHMDSASRRDVYLEGEALFEGTHDATRPFLVHTANGVAEDLGTRFVVTSYAADTIARVVVADGKVTIRARREMAAAADKGAPEQVLTAGDLGLLSRGGQITTTHRVALDQYFGWATGQLVFRNAPLREVATTLARWYAVDIRVSSPATAARRHVTLTTTPDQPLSEVLTALTVPLGLRAARSGDTVFISQ